MLSDLDKSYIAGIIDGEGCVGLRKRVNSLMPRVQVTNTNFKIIQFLNDKCGGSVYFSNSKKHSEKKWKQFWIWSITGKKCLDFLIDIYPYMILKSAHCEIIFSSFDIKNKDEKEVVFDNLRTLNKRGLDLN